VACEAQVSWVRNGAPAASWHFRISRRMQGRERESAVLSSLEKDLEGEQSPGRIGRPPAGNGRMGVTDPTAEQSLAAGVPVRRISKGRIWQRSRSGETSKAGGNGKGATATVTWCGCGRGEFFEGCEKRRGECLGTPTARCLARPGGRVDPEPDGRKRGEPHDWQRDATSPQPPERRKPPRWRKTTRAEHDSEAGSLGTEPGRQQCRFGGVDARKACRWRGVSTPDFAGPCRSQGLHGPTHGASREASEARFVGRIPREEVGNPTRATGEHSEGEPRPEGPRVTFRSSERETMARHRRKTSKTRRVTGKVKEGAGKTNDPLRRPRERRTSHLTMIGPRTALEPGQPHESLRRDDVAQVTGAWRKVCRPSIL
jgi:hypothetical protein